MSASKGDSQTKRWEYLGPISTGGTVFGLAISPVPSVPAYWAATSCGVFISRDGGQTWAQSLRGLTTPLLSAIGVAPNGALFAGALDGNLFVSLDFGLTWKAGLVPQELKATVTAVLASPKFSEDGTAFAATDGGGLLATRNSGNSWEDSSFGIGDATILTIAAAPDWSRNETMFAATPDGIFISRNGGRAWRETGFMGADEIVSVLAVSPAFDQDQTVFAGTEEGALYRSRDGGRTWKILQEGLGQGPINCLWAAPDFAESQRLVAGVGAEVLVSTDAGETWHSAAHLPGALLSLAGDGRVLLAGLYDAGVWKSTDAGETWASASAEFAARGFASLAAVGGRLYAIGPQEGLWRAEAPGGSWRRLTGLDPYLPLSGRALNAPDNLLVAGQEHGILRSTDGGETWALVCERQNVQALALAPDGLLAWAGTAEGQLLVSRDGGQTWQEAGVPAGGQEILSIAVSPAFAQDRTLFLGTHIPATGNTPARVALWRSRDGGETWQQLTTQTTDARWVDIAMPIGVFDEVASQAVLATGAYCLRPLRRAKDVWISSRVDPKGANVLSVLAIGEIDHGAVLYAATGNGIFSSIDSGRTWQPFSEGLGADSFISIIAAANGQPEALYALSLGGIVWRYALGN